MKKYVLWMTALLTFCCFVFPSPRLSAQEKDIAGTWQGTLNAGRELRLVLKISKDDGKLKGVFYSIDQGGQPINAAPITVQGSAVKMTIPLISGTYEGKVSADGNAMTGSWTQGPTPLPLNLARATPATAWEIPAAAPPPKLMAADANPSFDVATIKPNNSGGTSMQQLTVNGRNFQTRNSSLADLISFGYDVQAKQIVGGPDWIDKDRFDVAAVPDVEGAPNPQQLKLMIRKLVAERWKLTFHHDKRELSAFVLTVGSKGSKLKETELKGPLPGIGMSPGTGGLTLHVRNAGVGDFSGFLQSLVLDRPVVDQTGLTGKYDFDVTFAPDDTQFGGHAPIPPSTDPNVTPAAGLFQAMQDQLGLRLEAKKTAVDVLALDHVEKPSAN